MAERNNLRVHSHKFYVVNQKYNINGLLTPLAITTAIKHVRDIHGKRTGFSIFYFNVSYTQWIKICQFHNIKIYSRSQTIVKINPSRQFD